MRFCVECDTLLIREPIARASGQDLDTDLVKAATQEEMDVMVKLNVWS